MGFNSAFKGLKLLKTRGRAFKQFKDPFLNVLIDLKNVRNYMLWVTCVKAITGQWIQRENCVCVCVTSYVIQIIQPTGCNRFTSLLFDVYVLLNMFRGSPRPSSGACNCTRCHWFYRWREAAGALLAVVWQTTANNAPTAVC